MGDVVARGTVTPGSPQREPPFLVQQSDGDAVELLVDDVARPVAPQAPADAGVEGAQVVRVVSVIDGQHGHGVADRTEALDRLSADPLRWAVGGNQLGVLLLQLAEPPEEPIELPVAHRRRGLDVVQVIVALDLPAQFFDLFTDGAGHGDLLLPRRFRVLDNMQSAIRNLQST
jgi:hypothetical protein